MRDCKEPSVVLPPRAPTIGALLGEPGTVVCAIGAPPLGVDGCVHAVATLGAHAAAERQVALRLPLTLGRVAPRRTAGFLAGRYCALEALRGAGAPAAADVGRAADGAPVWPAGFVGSITHTERVAMAVAARADAVRSVGVDCEQVMSDEAADDIAPMVLPEADDVECTGARDASLGWGELMTAVFSAKESLYKCLHPLVRVFFEFQDARVVHADLARGELRMRLMRDLDAEWVSGREIAARFAFAHGHVYSAVWLAPPPAAGACGTPSLLPPGSR